MPTRGQGAISEHSQLELDPVAVGHGTDLFALAWLLLSKLVAREGQDAEAPRGQAVMQLAQLLVVPRGEASPADADGDGDGDGDERWGTRARCAGSWC